MKRSLTATLAVVASLFFVQCENEGVFLGDGSEQAGVVVGRLVSNTLPKTCYLEEFRGTYTHYYDTTITQAAIVRTIHIDPQDSLLYVYMQDINGPDSMRVYFNAAGIAEHTEHYSAPQGTSSRTEHLKLELKPYGVYANWSYRATESDPSIIRTCSYDGQLFY